jgi:hypothetical protein
MNLVPPSFQKWALCALAATAGFAKLPQFTVRDAIQAEWARQPLTWTESQKAALPPEDRARLERTLQRIGIPGAPALLPPELEKPALETWEAKAKIARTPQERFTALFFLNRLKSPKALTALDGLSPADAATWPEHLCLEASLATARLNGTEVSPALQAFLDARQKAGKVDPVRAQAARLRLMMAGKEQALLPPVPATPGSLLALMDAWNRSPWAQRRGLALGAFKSLAPDSEAWPRLGLLRPDPSTLERACVGVLSRLAEGVPNPAPAEAFQAGGAPWSCTNQPLAQWYGFQALAKLETPLPHLRTAMQLEPPFGASSPLMAGALLPAMRRQNPEQADRVRARLLSGPDAIAREAAIEEIGRAHV